MEFNSLIPEFSVSNYYKSKDFYIEILGFKIDFEREESKFIHLSYGQSQIMINEDNGFWITDIPSYPRGRGINFQIECENVTLLYNKLVASDLKIFQNIKEEWYRVDNVEEGVKEFLVQDPDGYLLRFQEYLGQREYKI